MNRVALFIFLFIISMPVFGQQKKAEIAYKQGEVYVVLNDKFVGTSPSYIKLDFALGGDLIFFKKGYYSYRIKIDPEVIFNKLTVDLIEKPKTEGASIKRLLEPDTLLVSSIVTNMTNKDIQEILDENFVKNNYFIGKNTSLFPEAVNELKSSRYKIAIEIVDSKQIRAVYKSPRFMMAYMKIRWSLLDKTTNKVVYYKSTEGTYFVEVQTSKGMVVSDMMLRVMEGAINEAQFKLLTDKEFITLIAKD